jgi:hypothetical protein
MNVTATANEPRRRGLRFSLRALAILITLLCLYLACWLPTSSSGAVDVRQRLINDPAEDGTISVTPKAPLLLLAVQEIESGGYGNSQLTTKRAYFFWFFGFVVQLPGATEQTSTYGRPRAGSAQMF